MPPRLWDAYTTPGIIDRERELRDGIKCAGLMGFGLKCGVSETANYCQIGHLLDCLEESPPSEAKPLLDKLADISLCGELHSHQCMSLLNVWQEKIAIASMAYEMRGQLETRIQQLDSMLLKYIERDKSQDVAIKALHAEVELHKELNDISSAYRDDLAQALDHERSYSGRLELEAETNFAALQNENLILQSNVEDKHQQYIALAIEMNQVTVSHVSSKAEVEKMEIQLASERTNYAHLQLELANTTQDISAASASLMKACHHLERCRDENKNLKTSSAQKETQLLDRIDFWARLCKSLGERLVTIESQSQLILQKYEENLDISKAEITKLLAENFELKKNAESVQPYSVWALLEKVALSALLMGLTMLTLATLFVSEHGASSALTVNYE